MILAYDFDQAVDIAHRQAAESGMRQRITNRPVLPDGMLWWVVETAPRVNAHVYAVVEPLSPRDAPRARRRVRRRLVGDPVGN